MDVVMKLKVIPPQVTEVNFSGKSTSKARYGSAHCMEYLDKLQFKGILNIDFEFGMMSKEDQRYFRNDITDPELLAVIAADMKRVPFLPRPSQRVRKFAYQYNVQKLQRLMAIVNKTEQQWGYVAEAYVCLVQGTIPWTKLPTKYKLRRINNSEYGCDNISSQETKCVTNLQLGDVVTKTDWALQDMILEITHHLVIRARG